jgi:hypothetical protein
MKLMERLRTVICPGLDMNRALPQYKLEALPLKQSCLLMGAKLWAQIVKQTRRHNPPSPVILLVAEVQLWTVLL